MLHADHTTAHPLRRHAGLSARSACVLAFLLAASALPACSAATGTGGPPNEVRAFTGAHTRVVWVQGDGTDPYAAGQNLVLMGFDSDDGQGERVIVGERQSYVKPLLTPRGDRIVFSTSPVLDGGPAVFIVNWDGTGLRRLASGFALTLWASPLDGSEWVYLGTDNEEYNFKTVSRFPIDDPSATELVWNQTLVSGDTFQVSADGRFAGGLFPWPEAGIAELPNRSWRKVGEGCWTAMSTVRGPLFWYFDGAHRNLLMFDQRTENRWTIPINTAPGFDNPEVYHPRWTNHPRFLAMSGPYDRGGANQVRSGGTQAEIWLGRFSEDFSAVEGWVRVTHNEGGDSYPDVWIDRDRSPHAARASGPIGPAPTPAPDRPGAGDSAAGAGAAERVVVEGRLRHAGPVPSPQSILPYRHALVVSEYDIERVVAGTYEPQTIRVAHWAIRDSKVLGGARPTPGSAVTLSVERYDAHPELEGERLITDLGASDLPLYYEVAR
jgi:hypothetical protein